MGSYPLDVLVRKWALDEVSVEQVIGQLIQILLELVKRIEKLEASKR